ncbi:MAG: hypothetical protein J6L73_01275 [Muribaculaceae bacterium]|nr:hypothetical protein [Muribaculaceae bacterium]
MGDDGDIANILHLEIFKSAFSAAKLQKKARTASLRAILFATPLPMPPLMTKLPAASQQLFTKFLREVGKLGEEKLCMSGFFRYFAADFAISGKASLLTGAAQEYEVC